MCRRLKRTRQPVCIIVLIEFLDSGYGGYMSVQWKSLARVAACATAAVVVGTLPIGMKAQAPAPAAQAPAAAAGGRGGGSPIGPQLFTLFDGDKDGFVSSAEVKTTFSTWYDAADTQKSGSITQEQLSTAL